MSSTTLIADHVTPLLRLRRRLLPTPDPLSSLTLYWLAFIGAVLCFILLNSGATLPQPIMTGLWIASSVTCGLAWLLSRSLFRGDAPHTVWPIGLVGLLFICTLISEFASEQMPALMLAYVDHLQGLLGSAMLILIAFEAVNAPTDDKRSRQFRTVFIGSYLTILAIALAVQLPALSDWQTDIQIILSLLAATGATFAVRYRWICLKLSRSSCMTASDPDHAELAARLTRLIETGALYRQPGLKVSDLASRLNEPEYRVSQVIVHTLGQRNFNQWVNHYRIAEAKAQLCAPGAEKLSILNLSQDCGFNSLGPFNRAFKAETGLTPSAFRAKFADKACAYP